MRYITEQIIIEINFEKILFPARRKTAAFLRPGIFIGQKRLYVRMRVIT
ncbi:MAG: hypothetical protein H0X15_05705 [Acidobacteria bacterium]|nr:hypothetical protein [Acidobacteriota bacterium]MBA3785025.1 hypothetical protein [Acidobacteriota bacterium]MBA4121731.1 hypothetical protein [Acidobacteriota bacterium]MBA4183652.1 hypothetical protein [Acidobacteriota bacterium]